MTIKLYDGRISWNGRKIRLLAKELGIPLERITLDFAAGDYRTPEFLAKNPNGKVPTIDDDGFVLWESHAILRYLADKHPERGLAGTDPKTRALVDQWLFWYTAHVGSALDMLLRERRIKAFLKQEAVPEVIAEAESQLGRFLPILDAQLAGGSSWWGG
jgi:glutathione S-transferase